LVKQFNAKFRVGQGGIKQVSSDVTLGEGEDQLVLVDASGGNVTVTLQRADGSGGKRLCIKKIDSSDTIVTVVPSTSQTIDGQTSFVLFSQNDALDIISDNENWLRLVKVGSWSVIGDYEAPDDNDNSHEFLFAPITFEDDCMLVLVFDGSLTASSGALQLLINGINGPVYFSDGRRIVNGVETIIDVNTAANFQLATAVLLTGVNVPVHVICYIQLNKSGSNTHVGIQSFANGILARGNENISGMLTTSISSITDISIDGRIRNFQQGSRATLYKVSRLG